MSKRLVAAEYEGVAPALEAEVAQLKTRVAELQRTLRGCDDRLNEYADRCERADILMRRALHPIRLFIRGASTPEAMRAAEAIAEAICGEIGP